MTATIDHSTDVQTRADWDVNREELHRVLTDVAPAMSTDTLVPVLCAMRLYTTDDGRLHAVATDRFVAAHAVTEPVTHAVGERSGSFDILIGRDDIKRIIALIKPKRGESPVVRVTTDGDSITFDVYTAQLSARRVDGDFPNVNQLFARFEPGDDPVDVFRVNLARLATFKTTAKRDNQGVTMEVGKRGGMVRIQRENFVGLVMQMRTDAEFATAVGAPEWLE